MSGKSCRFVGILALLSLLFVLSCRGVLPLPPLVPCSPIKSSPQTDGSVFLVVFENQKYETLMGNRHAPYFNELARENALATNFYANTHPSLGNYFMMTTGEIITNDLNFDRVIYQDNLGTQMCANGVSWKGYFESMPEVGYTKDRAFPYVKSHNPFAYFGNVIRTPSQCQNMVPLTQLAPDLANNALPSFVYIIPNQINNLHDCPQGGNQCPNDDKLPVADQWLMNNVKPILDSPSFQRNGLMIITFDESFDTDPRHGGGHIPTILIGPNVKKNYQSTTFYQLQSILRLVAEHLKVSTPGAAADAPVMDEFFIDPPPTRY